MPKTRKRKKGTTQKSAIGAMKSASVQNSVQPATGTAALRRPGTSGFGEAQGLIWPALVSLGCWGLAASFFFFSNDPNHILFGALVVIMALLWTFSLVVRVRKVRALRQK